MNWEDDWRDANISYSLNSLTGNSLKGVIQGSIIMGAIKGDTRCSDYSSYGKGSKSYPY